MLAFIGSVWLRQWCVSLLSWLAIRSLVWRFEHGGFPLSWAFAGTAVLAFLAAEFSHSDSSLPDVAEGLSSQPAPEWEAAGFEG